MQQDPTVNGAVCRSGNPPMLTAALVVCRECLAKHNISVLPYVVTQIDAFLDSASGPGALVAACSRGLSEHLLAYIASRDIASFWNEAAVNAAANGHVRVLEWLSSTYDDRCAWGTNVMDAAARHGHIKMVQWLHKHRKEGCSTDTMDWAICRGDVVMARWLQAHRTEGCTDFAMNYAAVGGHLEVLQWMSENRSEGRPGLALRIAAQNGRLMIVQWLYTRCNDKYRRLALEDAKKFGHSAVAEWLQKETSKSWSLHKFITDTVEWIWLSLNAPVAIKTRARLPSTDHLFSK